MFRTAPTIRTARARRVGDLRDLASAALSGPRGSQLVSPSRRWWLQASQAAHVPGFGARRHPTVRHDDDLASSFTHGTGK
jgi:hypothetical protein